MKQKLLIREICESLFKKFREFFHSRKVLPRKFLPLKYLNVQGKEIMTSRNANYDLLGYIIIIINVILHRFFKS